MGRARGFVQDKNRVAFGWNNKKRKTGDADNKVSYRASAPGWCDCLQSARFNWKCSLGVENKLSAREVKMAAHFLCFVIQWEACVWFTQVLCSQYSDKLSSLATGMCLSVWRPPFFSTSISLVPLSGLSCTSLAFLQACRLSSWAQTFCSTLDVDLSWVKDKKESLRAGRTRNRSIGKAKD